MSKYISQRLKKKKISLNQTLVHIRKFPRELGFTFEP